MNKIFAVGIILFALVSLSVHPQIVFGKTPDSASAKDSTVTATTTSDVVVTADSEDQKDTYVLPYPGILPDHPLYFLKRFRDFILDALIVDPLRKGEFYVLQADKRLNMGIALIAKSNAVLGEQVISRGEKYMLQAVEGFALLKANGKEVPGYIIDKLERALATHRMLLQNLVASAQDAQRAGLQESLELVRRLEGDIERLK